MLEILILLYGLNYCIPPMSIKRGEIYSDFEDGYLNAKLNDLTHLDAKLPFLTLNLNAEGNFISPFNLSFIPKPDKGSGVVILKWWPHRILLYLLKFCSKNF